MYVTRVPNRGSPPAILLRESYRDGDKVKTRTLANLSRWPEAKIEALKRALNGETLVALPDRLAIERSLPHGHVAAVLGTARRLGLDRLLPRRPGRRGPLGAGLGRRARDRAGGQAGDGAPAQRGDRGAFAGRGAGLGCGRRGRALPTPRSPGRGTAEDRGGAGQTPSSGWRAGALRPHLELSGGPVLRARPVRLQPRRQAGQAADRLPPAPRRGWLPGRRRGVRGRRG